MITLYNVLVMNREALVIGPKGAAFMVSGETMMQKLDDDLQKATKRLADLLTERVNRLHQKHNRHRAHQAVVPPSYKQFNRSHGNSLPCPLPRLPSSGHHIKHECFLILY
jgi:hypothetical protein